MDRILLIHSDPKAADELAFVLKHSGFQVVTAVSEHQSLAEINKTEADAIIMPEALAKTNGDEPYIRIREMCKAPIIILGEGKEERARIHFLESGADAYLPSPLSPRLLLAQVHSLLRRCKGVGKTEGG